ncbi:MAG: tRNA pseudouridine(38-40) synthase TruA [Coriobacteriales bacterium]|jgi:tRNA pseudouridine38-40 synthase
METSSSNLQHAQVEHESLHTLVLELGYRGSAYSGFAKQKDPAIPTVQAELERALSTLARRDVELVCAGRTDAGVHARGQVVSCTFERDWLSSREPRKLMTSLNALTPDDIAVKRVAFADAGFSARFDAVSREYRYRICTGPTPPLFLQDFAWWHRAPLDVDAMDSAARCLVGEHDFKSFCKAQSAVGKTTMRCVERLDLYTETQLGEDCLVIDIVGNAFLHSMVRTIVGTLVRVGAGRKDPSWVAEVLAARDRNAAGENAPAKGLTFWQVNYPNDLIRDTLD